MITSLVLIGIFSGCCYISYEYVAKRFVLPYDARQMGLPKNYEMACNWNEIRVFDMYKHETGYFFPRDYNIYTFPDVGLTGVFKDVILPQPYSFSMSSDALWYTDTLYQVIEISNLKYYTLMTLYTAVPGSVLFGVVAAIILAFDI